MKLNAKKPSSTKEGVKPFLYMGIAAFLVIAASVTFFFILYRMDEISSLLDTIISILQPIIYGFVIAYLLNPIMMFFEEKLYPYFKKGIKNQKKAAKFTRYICIFIALIIGVICLFILGSFIIPQLVVSVTGIVKALPEQVESFTKWAADIVSDNKEFGPYIQQGLVKGTKYMEDWIQTDLIAKLNTWISFFATGVIGIVNVLKNMIIGIIVSIYVLNEKDRFAAQGKMIMYALFKEHIANTIIDTVRQSNHIFSGFIIGKIIDSTIIGILCFFGLTIFGMPYPLLISVIVGVTNIIPFFGPYIGAIPSAFLILFVSPIQCLYFVLFILVLQQIDGNIIGPTILGDSTGLSAFWVIFSILLGGGLFGIVGMIIGVPTFAVIYYIIDKFIEYCLTKRNLMNTSENYKTVDRIVKENAEIVYKHLDSPILCCEEPDAEEQDEDNKKHNTKE